MEITRVQRDFYTPIRSLHRNLVAQASNLGPRCLGTRLGSSLASQGKSLTATECSKQGGLPYENIGNAHCLALGHKSKALVSLRVFRMNHHYFQLSIKCLLGWTGRNFRRSLESVLLVLTDFFSEQLLLTEPILFK